MNKGKLANVIRVKARRICSQEKYNAEDFDTAELLKVLARIVDGVCVTKAFGSPGEWGYGTEIGSALAE